MAEKRMFSKKISDSDAFIELPSSAQALYFHLNQGADDDGFNNQIQIAMLKAHAGTDDLKILLAKNFIIRFESGVVVIKHWLINNTLRMDRYTPTSYQEELKMLTVKDNGAYTLGCQTVAERLPDGCQTVAKRLPQYSIDKYSIDKYSIESNNGGKKHKVFTPPTLENVKEYAKKRGREDIANMFFDYYSEGNWIDSSGNKVRNWKQKFITWCSKNPKKETKTENGSFDTDEFFQLALKKSYKGEK